jgi:pimeloyl-ACP methyl ester carboxylesterase
MCSSGAELAAAAGTNTKLSDEVVEFYVRMLRSDSNALARQLRFLPSLVDHRRPEHVQFASKLTIPVLAIGGGTELRRSCRLTMRAVANEVQTVVISGSGHWVAEEAPDQIVAALTAFLD